MEDSVKLDAFMELDLVLIAYSGASQTQADELATAARTGSTIQAPTLFKLRSLSFSSILLDLVPQQPVVQIDLQAGGGTAAAALEPEYGLHTAQTAPHFSFSSRPH